MESSSSFSREPYRDRLIRPLGVRRLRGWRLKTYGIVYEGELFLPVYEDGLAVVLGELPDPPLAKGRLGVGFIIFHQGRGVHFLSLHWWDRENELFQRVMIRGAEEDDLWVYAREGEVGCVWDLQVVAFERDAYVSSILAGEGEPEPEAYLGRVLSVAEGRF